MSIATPTTEPTATRRGRLTLLGAAVALALCAPGLGAAVPGHGDRTANPVRAVASPTMPASFADMAARVRPAVVHIATTRAVPTAGESPEIPAPFQQFMERFGGPMMRPGTPVSGVGSGFIISDDGYIVTSQHVIAGADEVTVTLDDGTEHAAEIRGTDERTDLALLKITPPGALPYVVFGDSSRARVGDWVVAVGSPFGLGGTVSAGIVSARGRNIGSGPYDDFIQTDAPINRGNSGGPLFNAAGEVVGVNTAIFSPSGGSVGIGFAVPAALAQPVLAQLRSRGEVDRGWLGVRIQDITEALAKGLRLPSTTGALVAGVQPDSPAQRGAIQPGDVVLAVDGKPVDGGKALARMVGERRQGERVSVKIWREGRERDLTISLGKLQNDPPRLIRSAGRSTATPDPSAARLGVQITDLTAEERARWRLGQELQGALIVSVAPGSPAAEQRLAPGDVIVQVDRQMVTGAEGATAAIHGSVQRAAPVVLRIHRHGSERFVALDPAARG